MAAVAEGEGECNVKDGNGRGESAKQKKQKVFDTGAGADTSAPAGEGGSTKDARGAGGGVTGTPQAADNGARAANNISTSASGGDHPKRASKEIVVPEWAAPGDNSWRLEKVLNISLLY